MYDHQTRTLWNQLMYALNINDVPKANPVDVLAKRRVVNDEG